MEFLRNIIQSNLSHYFEGVEQQTVKVGYNEGIEIRNLRIKNDFVNSLLQKAGVDARLDFGHVGKLRLVYTALPGIVTVQINDLDLRVRPNFTGTALRKVRDSFVELRRNLAATEEPYPIASPAPGGFYISYPPLGPPAAAPGGVAGAYYYHPTAGVTTPRGTSAVAYPYPLYHPVDSPVRFPTHAPSTATSSIPSPFPRRPSFFTETGRYALPTTASQQHPQTSTPRPTTTAAAAYPPPVGPAPGAYPAADGVRYIPTETATAGTPYEKELPPSPPPPGGGGVLLPLLPLPPQQQYLSTLEYHVTPSRRVAPWRLPEPPAVVRRARYVDQPSMSPYYYDEQPQQQSNLFRYNETGAGKTEEEVLRGRGLQTGRRRGIITASQGATDEASHLASTTAASLSHANLDASCSSVPWCLTPPPASAIGGYSTTSAVAAAEHKAAALAHRAAAAADSSAQFIQRAKTVPLNMMARLESFIHSCAATVERITSPAEANFSQQLLRQPVLPSFLSSNFLCERGHYNDGSPSYFYIAPTVAATPADAAAGRNEDGEEAAGAAISAFGLSSPQLLQPQRPQIHRKRISTAAAAAHGRLSNIGVPTTEAGYTPREQAVLSSPGLSKQNLCRSSNNTTAMTYPHRGNTGIADNFFPPNRDRSGCSTTIAAPKANIAAAMPQGDNVERGLHFGGGSIDPASPSLVTRNTKTSPPTDAMGRTGSNISSSANSSSHITGSGSTGFTQQRQQALTASAQPYYYAGYPTTTVLPSGGETMAANAVSAAPGRNSVSLSNVAISDASALAPRGLAAETKAVPGLHPPHHTGTIQGRPSIYKSTGISIFQATQAGEIKDQGSFVRRGQEEKQTEWQHKGGEYAHVTKVPDSIESPAPPSGGDGVTKEEIKVASNAESTAGCTQKMHFLSEQSQQQGQAPHDQASLHHQRQPVSAVAGHLVPLAPPPVQRSQQIQPPSQYTRRKKQGNGNTK